MIDGREQRSEEIGRSNPPLRAWACQLSARSRSTSSSGHRDRVRAVELCSWSEMPGSTASASWRSPRPAEAVAGAELLPSLGQVCVGELMATLIERHGLDPPTAARGLALGLAIAGYPMSSDWVAAVDTFDILDWALHER